MHERAEVVVARDAPFAIAQDVDCGEVAEVALEIGQALQMFGGSCGG